MGLSLPKSKKRYSPNITSGNSVKHLSLPLENIIGSFMSLVKLLEDRKILILGLSMQDNSEFTVLRIIVSDPEEAKQIFLKKNIFFIESEVLVVELNDGAAGLHKCLSYLLLAESNILYSYPLLCRPNDAALLVINTDELDFAGSVLRDNGYKLITQNDLSR